MIDVAVLGRLRLMILEDAGRVATALYLRSSSCKVSIADEASMPRGLATRSSLL
jgi:hypothetical protein